MKIKALLFFALTLLYVSCKDDDDYCSSSYLEYTTLEAEYGCENSLFDMQVDWEGIENNYILITNQSDFEEKASSTCLPEIDFENYDLILILTGTSNLDSYNYYVVNTCQNTISIAIDIEGSGSNHVI